MSSPRATISEPPIAVSQFGDDQWAWAYFDRRRTGFFVEVGANDPRLISQTWWLEQQGWRGILVEPIPRLAERCRTERPGSQVFQVACGSPAMCGPKKFRVAASNDRSALADCENFDEGVEFTEEISVTVRTLDQLLAEAGHPKIDLVSIDVEGGELSVLLGFDLRRHQPALLIVEDYVFTLAVHRQITGSGYKLIRRSGSNNWYVPARTHFPMPLSERWRLFRKMYLGTPWRHFKWRRQRQHSRSAP